VRKLKITKKAYYKKKKTDCPCCGWHGMSETNRRKWLASKNTNKLIEEELEITKPIEWGDINGN